MVYRPNIDEKLCFVLMPFEEPFNDYYKKIISPAAAQAGLKTLRADEVYGSNTIIRDIWDFIWRARVVIADVTGKNANVNYELGLCHALGVPTILITKQIEDVPFDYRHRRCLIYDTNRVEWSGLLQDALIKTIHAVMISREEEDLKWPYDTSRIAPAVGTVLLSSENPRDLVIQGISNVKKRIAKAFGPAGRSFSLSIGNREPLPYKQGHSIAQGTRASNPFEARGISEMRQVAEEIYDRVGDGTKIGILVTEGMITGGNEALKQGVSSFNLLAGMRKGVDQAIEYLLQNSHKLTGRRLFDLARTAGMNSQIGELIYEAINKVGRDGVIAVEESLTADDSLEVVEGMELDRGFLSQHFVTDAKTNEAILDEPYILISARRISSMRELLPLLEKIATVDMPLVIIAEDVDGEALATLVVNKLRGTLKVAAIKAPGFDDRRKAILDDISVLTGGKIVGSDLGTTLEKIELEDLGRAKRIRISSERSTIVEGRGNPAEIELRVKTLRLQADETTSPYDREKLQERLARLVGGVAVIRIGGISPLEVLDKKYRCVSAMHSTRSGIEEGWVPGGAASLHFAGTSLTKSLSESESLSTGIKIVADALEKPLQHLIENADGSPTQVLHEIDQTNSNQVGFNVDGKRVEDLTKGGVIDATKVLRVSLEVALQHAKSVLETEDWDIEQTKQDEGVRIF